MTAARTQKDGKKPPAKRKRKPKTREQKDRENAKKREKRKLKKEADKELASQIRLKKENGARRTAKWRANKKAEAALKSAPPAPAAAMQAPKFSAIDVGAMTTPVKSGTNIPKSDPPRLESLMSPAMIYNVRASEHNARLAAIMEGQWQMGTEMLTRANEHYADKLCEMNKAYFVGLQKLKLDPISNLPHPKEEDACSSASDGINDVGQGDASVSAHD